jgi:hypothetical protein
MEPLRRLQCRGEVTGAPMHLTVGVKRAEQDHGVRVALGGGLLVPLARLGVVLTVGVKQGHGARVALVSGQRRNAGTFRFPARLLG